MPRTPERTDEATNVNHQFGVMLQRESETRYLTFPAVDRHVAVRMAEEMEPGFSAHAVTRRYEILGRCLGCRAVIFESDRHVQELGNGEFRCEDCSNVAMRMRRLAY